MASLPLSEDPNVPTNTSGNLQFARFILFVEQIKNWQEYMFCTELN